MRAAVIDSTGLVVNVILVNDLTFGPGDGLSLASAPDGVSAGYTYASGVFSAPPIIPVQSLSQAEFIAALGGDMQTLWAAAAGNAMIAQWMATGLTSDPIRRSIALPAMQAIEAAGVLPAGTAARVWA